MSESDVAILRLARRIINRDASALLLHRSKISEQLDIVVAPINAKPSAHDPKAWNGGDTKLGLFLQDRAKPGLIYQLALEDGRPDCEERVLRATASEVVLSCRRASTGVGPHRKYIFNTRSRKLLRKIDYEPYTVLGVFPSGKSFVFIGSNTVVPAAFEYSPSAGTFRALSNDQAMRWNAQLQKGQELPPALTEVNGRRTLAGLASGDVTDIGPWWSNSNQFWYGKSFYVGEASGGFGWFDVKTKKIEPRSPAAMKDASVTALLPETSQVWFALARREQDISTPIGLLKFNRATEVTAVIPVQDYINAIARSGARLLLATDSGITIIENEKARRYFVDQAADGKLSVVPSEE